ncbi:hypothetical protein VTK73DRAFT_3847 [Phialemonium thermophilum]|uniref:Secreted protein n=1 Tax=Phialemonium thermophilum TaxID=223376 RepID=A0ABR3VFN1_9PEZI
MQASFITSVCFLPLSTRVTSGAYPIPAVVQIQSVRSVHVQQPVQGPLACNSQHCSCYPNFTVYHRRFPTPTPARHQQGQAANTSGSYLSHYLRYWTRAPAAPTHRIRIHESPPTVSPRNRTQNATDNAATLLVIEKCCKFCLGSKARPGLDLKVGTQHGALLAAPVRR